MSEDGLWQITEAAQEYTERGGARYWLSLDVTLSTIKRKNRTTEKEETVTQNLSEKGASVYSSLLTRAGDKLKFACEPLDFHAIAIVRNCKVNKEKGMTLHLEFVDARIPVEKILALQSPVRS
jgi:hypothetical protein